jgi:hypothetical protein
MDKQIGLEKLLRNQELCQNVKKGNKMQKYHKGDLVHVVKDLGACMSHFTSDCDAIVMYTYKEQYGGDSQQEKSYCIHIKGKGETSWYEEHQLELIERNRLELLQQWENEEEKERKLHSDLDWIFANGNDVLHGASGATIDALGTCLGVSNLWGSHGEGFVYYQNATAILSLAKPFLESGDKTGWLAFAKSAVAQAAMGKRE